MKRFVYILSIVLITSNAVFAAWSQTGSNNSITMGNTVTTNVTLSNGISAGYSGSTNAYAIGTVHQNGTKSYGTSSASSSIYYDSVNVGQTTPTEVTNGQSTWDSATWTLEGK